jgi:hypothetical protein
MARRPTPPPPAPKNTLTPDELRNGIKRLQKRIEELEAFDPNKMTENRPAELQGLSTSIQTTLARAFGEGTADYQRFLPACKLQWSPPGFYYSGMPPTPLSDYKEGVADNREYSLVQLGEAVRTLEEDLAERTPGSEAEPIHIRSNPSRKVFLVHGRDDGPREAVARFLERLGFEPIILHEQANQGRTVIEKVEAHSDVGFAVVLLTPDDEGNLRGEAPQPRARQNVLLELGYFIGKLTRHRVCTLKAGELEVPSDWRGVVDEPFNSEEAGNRRWRENWKQPTTRLIGTGSCGHERGRHNGALFEKLSYQNGYKAVRDCRARRNKPYIVAPHRTPLKFPSLLKEISEGDKWTPAPGRLIQTGPLPSAVEPRRRQVNVLPDW